MPIYYEGIQYNYKPVVLQILAVNCPVIALLFAFLVYLFAANHKVPRNELVSFERLLLE